MRVLLHLRHQKCTSRQAFTSREQQYIIMILIGSAIITTISIMVITAVITVPATTTTVDATVNRMRDDRSEGGSTDPSKTRGVGFGHLFEQQ